MRDLTGQLEDLFKLRKENVCGAAVPLLAKRKVVLIELSESLDPADKNTIITTIAGIVLCHSGDELECVEIHTALTHRGFKEHLCDFIQFDPSSGFTYFNRDDQKSQNAKVLVWG